MKNTITGNDLIMIFLYLLKQKEMYGYELTKMIKEKTNNTFTIKMSTLYPSLRKLIDAGYVKTRSVVVDNKTRVYYSLKKEGELYLNELIEQYLIKRDLIDSLIFDNNDQGEKTNER